jgi:hypothetical protein
MPPSFICCKEFFGLLSAFGGRAGLSYPSGGLGGRLSGFSRLLERRQLRGQLVALALGLLTTLAFGVEFLANPVPLLAQRRLRPLGKFEAGSCVGRLGGLGLQLGGHPVHDLGQAVRHGGHFDGLLAVMSGDTPAIPQCLQGVFGGQPCLCYALFLDPSGQVAAVDVPADNPRTYS